MEHHHDHPSGPRRDDEPEVHRSQADRRDTVRVLVVAVCTVVALIGSFIGSGAASGTPIRSAAGGALSADATLVAPATQAFSIWTVIYLGLIGYGLWQILPAQRSDPRQRRIGYPMALSMLLNAAWILSIQADLLLASVPIIVALLADLAWIFVRLRVRGPRNPVDAVLVDGTAGLYLGWVCVATAANITAVLVAVGFDGLGVPPTVWAAAVVVIATGVGVWLAASGRGRIAPTLSLGWGLAWIAVARLADHPASPPTAITAIAAVIVLVAVTLTVRLRRPGPVSSS